MNELINTLGLFLYFPQDKSEYIPAGIMMLICGIAAYVTFRLIIRFSKKEQQKADELIRRMEVENKSNQK
ncbi:hypothetical protein ABET51_12650 [Metabacillus fastidiosus]|uniref:hypothetical protein n=1 Tax=Metabacillus fastidiosus TaxID=1458 RepID=UPI002DB8C4DE|nr:hypothetical protein [Metabacillus fastidiosus]MEC2078580.1 hypothetical protein [Metabacillus fastidiosus]MED4533817.1 hypothetical protein [Metabacillus fastidiosus]